ncbi:MAG: hypothetical protein BWX86_02249 [Verrucomicrobia bacterium ADurb.Bin122]|nr:MAG: hypothetical protein BWX86_02249 [Verrucomicrobia bacterium ADurb.Bin122]
MHIHSIWSAWTLGVAYSTVAGKLRMILLSGVGSQTSVTASQISKAKSSSVLVKLSGEYSNRMREPAATSGCILSFKKPTACVAMPTMSVREAPKTYSRCLGEVEL